MLNVMVQSVSSYVGRGAFAQTLREARARQAEARAEMTQLVAKSKVAGSCLYLQCHVRTNKTQELRWRFRNGQHVLWEAEQAQEELKRMPLAIRKHCEALNTRARELYAMDAIFEHTARWCESVLERRSMRKAAAPKGGAVAMETQPRV